jgi:DNA mismatch repair protein MutS
MSIVIEYFEITKKYQEQYGKNTILLHQVGSFFEIYSFINPLTNEISNISDIEKVSEICNLNIARKSNSIGENTGIITSIEEFPCDPVRTKEWLKKLPKSEIVMAGFRDYSLEKYIAILTDAGYTAVVFVQVKDGKNITRKLDHVYSPGTYISDNSSTVLSNNVLSIWFEIIKSSKAADRIVIGCSNVDIFTGKSAIYEYETELLINPTTFDELEKFISEFNPNELILVYDFQDEGLIDTILQYIGTSFNMRIPIHKTNIYMKNSNITAAVNCTKQTYISQIISTFFASSTFQSCDFNSYQIATQSFCYLLNFLQEHNPDLVRKIHLPIFTNTSTKLLLANHTLRQLNIIDDTNGTSSGHLSSVLSFLNKSSTSMGKRKFKYQLLNPTFDQDWLRLEYSMIAYILNNKDSNFIPYIRKQLQTTRDIEKINRQLVSRKLVPNTLFYLCKTIETIKDVVHLLKDDIILGNYLSSTLPMGALGLPKGEGEPEVLLSRCSGKSLCDLSRIASGEKTLNQETNSNNIESDINDFLEFINSKFDIVNCQGVSSNTFEKNVIMPNVSRELDEFILEQEVISNDITTIRLFFNNLFKKNEIKNTTKDQEYVKIHETEKSGITFQMTKKRGTQLQNILSDMLSEYKVVNDKVKDTKFIVINECMKIPISDIKISTVGTNDEIHCVLLNGLCKRLLKNQEKVSEYVVKVYLSILTIIENEWYDKLESMAKFISKLDVIVCKAYNAREYRYCMPEISNDESEENAFVNCSGLRHILVEHINTKEIYVENDIILDGKTKNQGFLLYGTNSAGKTTLIRALGIAVILAQSGNYVPCHKFNYKPYTAIFSRIQNNDNLFMGLSSFALEMSEIRTIIKQADSNSLVLGDELCSSTDSISSISIFITTLMNLYKKKSSFIFATHLHEVSKYDELEQMTSLKFKHMSVRYNSELDKLVYERKLQEGSGNGNYGIEVAKSLHLPSEFIDMAYGVRNNHFPQYIGDLSLKTSTYNVKKLRVKCEICGEPSQHIHHINEQNTADKDGFIGSLHKNNPANLMSLCIKCHNKEHEKENL